MTKTLSALGLALIGGAMLGYPMDASAQGMNCITQASPESLAGRASPLDSVSFEVDGHAMKICYGRPSARGRTMIGGGAVPYGKLWRTGANEPTMIHTSATVSIAGVEVPAGTYSIYTVPGDDEWKVIVNTSYSQWGHEGQYTEEVAAQEAGSGTVAAETTESHVETFTIRTEDNHIVMEWENTRIRIPISTTT